MPARVLRNPSTLVDLELFVIGRLMVFFGLVGRVTATSVIAVWVAGLWAWPIFPVAALPAWGLALALWLLSDFASYWMHRLYHGSGFLWPLHAVHHSAAVLTPLTTYRQHPVGVLVSTTLQSAFIGVLQGLLLGTLSPDATLTEIAGVNAFVVLANAGLAALHHSHVWLSYGPVLERIIISPAQHQIHHSVNPAHYNRNYGNTLAVWDWAFGTLYLIRNREEISFGLTGKTEKALVTQRLIPILTDPLRRMWQRNG